MHRLLIALTAVSVLLPGVALAQITEVAVRVDGLSCPFCAYSLEKKLKAVEGVADLTIDVKEGVATLVPHDEVGIDFAALPAAVKQAGFTPREIRAAGIGRLATVDNQAALVGLDGTTLFLLEANDVLESLNSDGSLVFDFAGTVLLGTQEQRPKTARLALTSATARPRREEG